MIRATAAVLERDGKILLARRRPGGPLSGLWEFPGGKIEPGEAPADCLKRELLEELGLDAEIGATIATTLHRYPGGEVELTALEARCASGEPELRDHEEFAWVEPSRLLEYSLAPADVAIARVVAGRA
ncbi:MAG: (deoxy)nucleoside triphosphate pyrophosphohydrolase [Elusimicrobia bacterium]|nr:(deoxy)nucleoside triphosphate pyrophosphohydrolase [Elusimicrobiota bacterium]